MPLLKNDGADLYYEVHGTGPAVLLIHGLGSSALDWEYQLPALKDYKVIALDLRGHGRSSRAAGPYSMQMFSNDVAALLKHLQITSIQVVGLSLGGGIAFQLALDHPDLVKTLVIVNSGPHAVMETWVQRLAIWLRFVVLRISGLPKLGAMVSSKLYPKPEHAHKRRTFEERFAQNDKDSYRASLKALLGWTVQHRLGEIQCPTLMLTADQDYTPVAWKEGYVRQLAKGELVVIPDSHHAMPMENPEPFNAALLRFLSAHS